MWGNDRKPVYSPIEFNSKEVKIKFKKFFIDKIEKSI